MSKEKEKLNKYEGMLTESSFANLSIEDKLWLLYNRQSIILKYLFKTDETSVIIN